jgi:hypothetical protein
LPGFIGYRNFGQRRTLTLLLAVMWSLVAFVVFYGLAFGQYRLVPRRVYAGLPLWLRYPVGFGLFVLLPYTVLIGLTHVLPALSGPVHSPGLAVVLVLPVYWWVSARFH